MSLVYSYFDCKDISEEKPIFVFVFCLQRYLELNS